MLAIPSHRSVIPHTWTDVLRSGFNILMGLPLCWNFDAAYVIS